MRSLITRSIVASALLAATAGCVSSRQAETGSGPASPAGVAWRLCLNESYSVQSRTIPDRNQAAEVAFLSCQTEESAVTSTFPHDGPNDYLKGQQLLSMIRAKYKASLIAGMRV
jgi:hypothetical protein